MNINVFRLYLLIFSFEHLRMDNGLILIGISVTNLNQLINPILYLFKFTFGALSQVLPSRKICLQQMVNNIRVLKYNSWISNIIYHLHKHLLPWPRPRRIDMTAMRLIFEPFLISWILKGKTIMLRNWSFILVSIYLSLLFQY